MLSRDPSLGNDSLGQVTSGLATFAHVHPDVARDLLRTSTLKTKQFGPTLIQTLDHLLLGSPQAEELGPIVSAFFRLMRSVHWPGFLRCVLRDAHMSSASRARRNKPRSLWGTTPIISLTSCRAAERLLGVDAETLVFQTYYITRSFDIILQPFERWFSEHDPQHYEAFRWLVFLWALMRYDSFYYFNDSGILPSGGYGKDSFGINADEMRLIRQSGKALYTLAYGADYRTRTKTLASGRWNFCMDCPEVGRYCLCDDQVSERIFSTIARHATAVLGTGLSLSYLPNPKDLDYLVLDTELYQPAYTDAPIERPLRVVHVPNHPHFKGTRFLTDAVERLRTEGHPIELTMLTGVSHEQAVELMRASDIVADQFIGGSFGQTAVEAMALGKPVLCYVRDDRNVPERSQFPIINVDPDTLYATLADLCNSPEKLPAIGRRSREYVVKHYSLEAFALRLDQLYQDASPFAPPSWPVRRRAKRSGRYVLVSTAMAMQWRLRNLGGKAKYKASLVQASLRGPMQRSRSASCNVWNSVSRRLRKAPGGALHVLLSVLEYLRRTPGFVRRFATSARDWVHKEQSLTISDLFEQARLARHRLKVVFVRELNVFASDIDHSIGGVRSCTYRFGTILWRAMVSVRLAAARHTRSIRARTMRALRWLGVLAAPTLVKCLVVAARAMTLLRMGMGKPRTLWGITPILTLPLLARADRALGLRSDSMVFVTYYISNRFDINLKRTSDWVICKHPRLYAAFTKLVFSWALLRYDVFHYFCDRGILLPDPGPIGINERELDLLKRSGKRIFTYTYGADVRTREATFALGSLNFCMNCPMPGRLCICDDEKGQRNIATITRYANAMAAMGDMKAYIPSHIDLHFWPIDIERLKIVSKPRRPGPLRVAHAPNHPHFKGTPYLEDAIARLQAEGCPIELVRVQGVPNERVIELFRDSDVIAEQFIGGFHGYTALEAMALAKPVLAYIRSPDLLIDTEACPIINTTPDAIYDVLKAMSEGKYDLIGLGKRGRAYVERYYSIDAVAVRLADMYLTYAHFGNLGSTRVRRHARKLARSIGQVDAVDDKRVIAVAI
jgi:hypothetical protein